MSSKKSKFYTEHELRYNGGEDLCTLWGYERKS